MKDNFETFARTNRWFIIDMFDHYYHLASKNYAERNKLPYKKEEMYTNCLEFYEKYVNRNDIDTGTRDRDTGGDQGVKRHTTSTGRIEECSYKDNRKHGLELTYWTGFQLGITYFEMGADRASIMVNMKTYKELTKKRKLRDKTNYLEDFDFARLKPVKEEKEEK